MVLSNLPRLGLVSLVEQWFDLDCIVVNLISVFSSTSKRGKILLIVYIDDINITGDDKKEIDELKFKTHFELRIWESFATS
jgi:hypothetical protein